MDPVPTVLPPRRHKGSWKNGGSALVYNPIPNAVRGKEIHGSDHLQQKTVAPSFCVHTHRPELIRSPLTRQDHKMPSCHVSRKREELDIVSSPESCHKAKINSQIKYKENYNSNLQN